MGISMRNMKIKNIFYLLLALVMISCVSKNEKKFTGAKGEVKLITLDPGHFHAALIQKVMYNQIDPDVYVYAPESEDVQIHLNLINSYNTRKNNPTNWNEIVYTGNDFLEKMLDEKRSNVVVISGNNRKKTEYIYASVEAGMNVLADKPMAIDAENFELLKKAFKIAAQKGILLYDIMTERTEITTILQKEIMHIPEIFGTLERGTTDDPAAVRSSIHTFYKYVSGSVLKRPAWFFDAKQQGEGIADISTHLVDLVQWECFPEKILNYKKDIQILSAKRWPTKISPEEFNTVTRLKGYPEYLNKDLHGDTLYVYSNGEINYKIKGIHAKTYTVWNYRAPEDAGDAVYALMRGTKSKLVILQGKEQNYKPTLYIEPVKGIDTSLFAKDLAENFSKISVKYKGVHLKKLNNLWQVIIPQKFDTGHEAHFADVTKRFMQYLIDGRLPDWEVPDMLAKYYTTTQALELARKIDNGLND
jgi:predicted dehydrogenase